MTRPLRDFLACGLLLPLAAVAAGDAPPAPGTEAATEPVAADSEEARAAAELAAAEAALAEAEAALAREQSRAGAATPPAEAARPVVRPTALVHDRYRAQLSPAAAGGAPFQLFQIVVGEQHSSLSIALDGADGDADLLLSRGQPITRAADALMVSTGPTSRERIRLGRDTLPALDTDTYFLYVFRTQPGQRPLDLSIRLNLPADEALDALPSLPDGLRQATQREAANGTEAVFSTDAVVRLASASGAPPAERRFAIQVPEHTRGLDIDLSGDESDVDLFLVGPVPPGGTEPLRFDSQNRGADEAISVRSRTGAPLPAGRWDLLVRRLDQLPTDPLLLRVQLMPEDPAAGTPPPAPVFTPESTAPTAVAEPTAAEPSQFTPASAPPAEADPAPEPTPAAAPAAQPAGPAVEPPSAPAAGQTPPASALAPVAVPATPPAPAPGPAPVAPAAPAADDPTTEDPAPIETETETETDPAPAPTPAAAQVSPAAPATRPPTGATPSPISS